MLSIWFKRSKIEDDITICERKKGLKVKYFHWIRLFYI